MALVPQVVRAVHLPVIAAGGIADAQGVAAAMALGASGVQIGTAYMLCPEASTSQVHRAALASPDARHTALTRLFTGRPARGIMNRVMRELGPMNTAAPAFPLAHAPPLLRYAPWQRQGDLGLFAAVGRPERVGLPSHGGGRLDGRTGAGILCVNNKMGTMVRHLLLTLQSFRGMPWFVRRCDLFVWHQRRQKHQN